MAARLNPQTAPSSTSRALSGLPLTRRAFSQRSGSVTRRKIRLAASEEQQERRQQGSGASPSPPPPPPPPRPGQQQQQGNFAQFVPQAIQDYDGHIEQAKGMVEEAAKALQELDKQISEMQQDGVTPTFAVGLLQWSRRLSNDALETARRRHASLVAKRESFITGLRQLVEELEQNPPLLAPDETTADWMALAGYNWATKEDQDDSPEGLQKVLRESLEQTNSPNSVMWAAVVASMAISWVIGWAGTWWGIDAYRLLHDLPDLPTSASTWLLWTAPYVGGTLAAYALAPPLFSKCIFRVVAADQQQFYRKVPATSFVLAALVVAYCQCLVYQGLWQDVFTGWLGGSRDALLLTDSAALEDSVRQNLGTLVGAPRLPAFLVAPSAALLTGLLEGGYYWTMMAARDTSASIVIPDDDGAHAVVVQSPLQPSALSDEELPLVAARVALSSCYLALEATLTGSLWLAVGTSTAGLVTAILLSRRSSA